MPIRLNTLERLVVIRRRQGWTQRDVAKRLRVSLPTLRAWEQGTRNPSASAKETIAEFITKYQNKPSGA